MTDEAATRTSGYQRSWRRMLVDMEIPAWDQHFLTQFDPEAMADLYERANASGVMFSCKNLSGLCLWPTTAGAQHPGLAGRDVVAETVAALRARDIAACAYYSVIYDNWAFEHDPDWRFQPVQGWRRQHTPEDRHALCCPNSPGYRAHVLAQIADLFGRYEFECAFCDMSFWPGVCGCEHCRTRLRAEDGIEIPARVDWTGPDWCTFQAARERWIVEFTRLITDAMKEATPGISVYHNFAPGLSDWWRSLPFAVTDAQDFLGGDLYGDKIEQLIAMKLMTNLSRSRPVEFMTFATTSYKEHVELKSAGKLREQALAAAAESVGCMFIEAIDPIGTVNAGSYDRVGEALGAIAPFEAHLGGDPIEDVAVYFSSESKMSFASNGAPLAELAAPTERYPHMAALRGACQSLLAEHIPFGIVTRHQLGELNRYRVLVLPNVLRMDADEVAAIRAYVERGGNLYASRYSSLVETRGARCNDLMLADVLGVSVEREEPAGYVYAKPATDETAALVAPQSYLGADVRNASLAGGLLRLRPHASTETLATLTLPYGHPGHGHFLDRQWASIHTSPPWQDTDEPAIVRNAFGAGRAVYSAVDYEAAGSDAGGRVFAGLIHDLLGERATVRCATHPDVWMSAFHGPEPDTVRIALLNEPAVSTAGARLTIRPPAGRTFAAAARVPDGAPLKHQTLASGELECMVPHFEGLTMVVVHLA